MTGLFPTRTGAEQAARELVEAGFAREDISLMMSAPTQARDFGARELRRETSVRDEKRAGEGAAVGVAVGGVLGALAAGAVALVGLVAAPGVALVAAGPIVAALAGGASGGVAGGFLGALVGAGLPESDAKYASSRVLSGGILVGVHADGARATTARRILLTLGGTTSVAVMN